LCPSRLEVTFVFKVLSVERIYASTVEADSLLRSVHSAATFLYAVQSKTERYAYMTYYVAETKRIMFREFNDLSGQY